MTAHRRGQRLAAVQHVETLFVYRRLRRPRRPKDPTHTIRHIVEIMLREIATLPQPLPWRALWDSS